MSRQYDRDRGGRFAPVNSLVTRVKQEHQEHPLAVDAAGAGVALFGMKTGSYVKGTRALNALDSGQAFQLSRKLNQAEHSRLSLSDMKMDRPADAFKLADPTFHYRQRAKAFGQVKGQVPKELHRPLGEMKSAADLWGDTFNGVDDARRVGRGGFAPIDLLNFNHRPKHKLMRRVVENSDRNAKPLYRGMGLPARPKVGDEFELDQSSWSSKSDIADMFSQASTEAKKLSQRGAKNGGGNYPVVLHLPEGRGRSTRIDGLTRTAQAEHVTPKGRYRVIDDDGHTVHVERIEDVQKNDPFGIQEMVRKNLTQEQIDRRKKVQAATSITTATLGLGALGALGAKTGARPLARAAVKRGVLKPVNDKKLENFERKADGVRNTALTVGAGVGGLGGYNFASYTRAEAKQRKKQIKS